jgi:hypothetical protein
MTVRQQASLLAGKAANLQARRQPGRSAVRELADGMYEIVNGEGRLSRWH